MTEAARPRPQYKNINMLSDLPSYRMPMAAWVSILHRASGALMFFLLPFIVWLFDTSLSSELSYARFTSAFSAGLGIFPGWFIKLVTLALIWSYLHHLLAGMRHVYMDVTHKTTKEFGRQSATVTIVLALLLTLVLGAKLFGLY